MGGAEVLDTNEYYPFGMNFIRSGISDTIFDPLAVPYNYKYNGKELQETGMYDYGARFYMPDIGRWGVVDPLAEKYPDISPYVYTANNPIKFIDPDGRDIVPSKAFLNSGYGGVYGKLMKSNSQYQNYLSKYANSKDYNFYLYFNDNKVSPGAFATTYTLTNFRTTMQGNKILSQAVTGAKSDSYYAEYVFKQEGYDISEIAIASTLIHEAIHGKIASISIKGENDGHNTFNNYHNDFLKALKEYNTDNNLGYSDQQLLDLSWQGTEKSKQFKSYIDNLAKENNSTYEAEYKNFKTRLQEIIWQKTTDKETK